MWARTIAYALKDVGAGAFPSYCQPRLGEARDGRFVVSAAEANAYGFD